MAVRIAHFWRRFQSPHPPFIHPDDMGALRRLGRGVLNDPPLKFASFIRSRRFGSTTDRRFHLSLLPSPFSGNLRRADIFILLLNPGVSAVDYYAEHRSPRYRRALIQKLKQDFSKLSHPFIALDPQFCWTGAYRWWEAKLRQVVRVIADKRYDGSYLKALQALSKRIVAIELVPYHSAQYRVSRGLHDQLPSSIIARNYVKEVLLKRAKKGRALIIVTRKPDVWGLEPLKCRNGGGVVVYKGGQARSASLGKNTKAGKAILKRFGISKLPT